MKLDVNTKRGNVVLQSPVGPNNRMVRSLSFAGTNRIAHHPIFTWDAVITLHPHSLNTGYSGYDVPELTG